MQPNARARAWAFTLNNWEPADEAHLRLVGCAECTRYLVFGREKGDNGTPHLQGYIAFTGPKSFSSVKHILAGKLPNNNAGEGRHHIERARSNAGVNRRYCTKGGDFEEFGEQPQQGKRTDLGDAISTLHSSGRMSEVRREHPDVYVKFHRGLAALRQGMLECRHSKPWVAWLHGHAGCGKSRLASTIPGSQYWAQPDGVWWDGYEQQDVVIVDDVCWSFKTTLFKRLCDYYPLKVPVKGGFEEFTSPAIVFTCVVEPQNRFECDNKEPVEQVLRRIDFTCDVSAESIEWCDFDGDSFWKQAQEN